MDVKLWNEEHAGTEKKRRKLSDDSEELKQLTDLPPDVTLPSSDVMSTSTVVSAEVYSFLSVVIKEEMYTPPEEDPMNISEIPANTENENEVDVLDESIIKQEFQYNHRALHENVQDEEKKDLDSGKIRTKGNDKMIINENMAGISEKEKVRHSKTNCQGRKTKLTESYMDFLLENREPSEYGSSSFDESTAVDLMPSEETTHIKKKIKRTHTDDKKVGDRAFKKIRINKRKQNKELQNKGLQFEFQDGIIQNKRELQPNPCIGKKCGNNCQDIGEDKRKAIFEHYWSLSSQAQQDWLISMTKTTQIKRKRSKYSGRRCKSFEYYIDDDEERRRVCQQFILNTLDIKQNFVHFTLTNSNVGSSKDDMREKPVVAKKTESDKIQNVKNFIQQLPVLPSLYCRKDSTKVYLPAEFGNLKNVYRIYKEEKMKENIDTVSERSFMQIFKNEFNIGIHVPKKDKCTKCIKYDIESTVENKKLNEEHLKERDASLTRFKTHREITKDYPETLCVSFDLQNVLNTPYGDSPLLYYSRKLSVYNVCFYENETREGLCFIWSETHGTRGANEIATIIQMYIDIVDSRKSVKHLILYCNSCPRQNKNVTVLAAIHNTLTYCKYIESIQINYLLPGHAEMSVKSMHPVIEESIKRLVVWAPSQWATICQLARKQPRPYQVHFLQHTDFKGYDEVADKYFKGNLTGKMSKIRIATFKKSCMNKMMVQYSMQSDAVEKKISVLGKDDKIINPEIYKEQLPITEKKFNDLKNLCDSGAIPNVFRNEYLNLPFCSTMRDTLNETDIEDDAEY